MNAGRPTIVVDGIAIIPLTRGKVAVVDAIDADLGDVPWMASKRKRTWYACRIERGVAIYLHRVVAKRAGREIAGVDVDHEDRDGLNCRRLADNTQNARNTAAKSTNTSGVKGVSWHRGASKWTAQIRGAGGRKIYLGLFDTKEDAASAYAEAATRLHGEFARLA